MATLDREDFYSLYGATEQDQAFETPKQGTPNPFAEPGRLTVSDFKPLAQASAPTGDVLPLPAVGIDGNVPPAAPGDTQRPNPQIPESRPSAFVDSGKFDLNEFGRVAKTTSADGKKVREFTYDPQNPDEVTSVTIDGNRQYFRSQFDKGSYDYYENGVYVGQWRGTISMSREGVYSYVGEKEGAHTIGSGNLELTPAQIEQAKTIKPEPIRPVLPQYDPIVPVDYRPPADLPQPPRPQPPADTPQPQPPRPQTDTPQPPTVQPSGERPDVPAPPEAQPKAPEKLPVLKHYESENTDDALRAAASNGLLVFVRVGSPSCPPCRKMEEQVWPGVETEFQGQGVFLHLDGDEGAEGKHGALAKSITDLVSPYPTTMVLRAFVDQQNQVRFEQVRDAAGKPRVAEGGMTKDETLDFLGLRR